MAMGCHGFRTYCSRAGLVALSHTEGKRPKACYRKVRADYSEECSIFCFGLFRKEYVNMTRLTKLVSNRVCFCLVLIVFSYLSGSARTAAPPCKDCACKFAYNWVNVNTGPAIGMKTGQTGGSPIQKGVNIGAALCDTPPIVQQSGFVSRFHWNDFHRICNPFLIQNVTIEAVVTDPAVWEEDGIVYTTCTPQPIP